MLVILIKLLNSKSGFNVIFKLVFVAVTVHEKSKYATSKREALIIFMIFEKMTSRETRNSGVAAFGIIEIAHLCLFYLQTQERCLCVLSLMDYFFCIRYCIYIKRWKWPFVVTAKADEIKSTHDCYTQIHGRLPANAEQNVKAASSRVQKSLFFIQRCFLEYLDLLSQFA